MLGLFNTDVGPRPRVRCLSLATVWRCPSVGVATDVDAGKMYRRTGKVAFQNVGPPILGGGCSSEQSERS